jgi:hypothetical protein
MTTTRVATSTQKIVAIDAPPDLLLNLQFQLCNRSCKGYIVPDTNSSKTIESAKPPCHSARVTGLRRWSATEAPSVVWRHKGWQRPLSKGAGSRAADTASGFTQEIGC